MTHKHAFYTKSYPAAQQVNFQIGFGAVLFRNNPTDGLHVQSRRRHPYTRRLIPPIFPASLNFIHP
jgi:hypothetical protein